MSLTKLNESSNLNTDQIIFNNDELSFIKGNEYRCINCRIDFDKKTVMEFLGNIKSKKGNIKKRPICPKCNSYLKSKIYFLNKKRFE